MSNHFTFLVRLVRRFTALAIAGAVASLICACGGSASAPVAPALFGTKQLGVANTYTQGNAVATDASANVYVAGYTEGGLDGNALTGVGDFFLTKYNSAGAKLYTKQLGVPWANTYGQAVATDTSGNVYVAGQTSDGLDGNRLIGSMWDGFLTKYNSAGDKLYTNQLGVAGANTYGHAVATDTSGNVYVAGYTDGGLDGNARTGTEDFFLTKYDNAGNWLYTKQLGTAGAMTIGYAVATDASENVYVAGYTTGGLDGKTLTGTEDFFLTKFDSTGTKLYTNQLGTAGTYTEARAVATDTSRNVYVAGYTAGGLDGKALIGTEDFFLTKYDSTGTKLFTRQLGVAVANTNGFAVATDDSGSVYVSGYTDGGLDGNRLTGLGDFVLIKYNSAGDKLYTKQLGVGGANTIGRGVATDASGNVYGAGYTQGGLDGNTRTGLNDFFLTRYNGATGTKN